MGQVFILKNSLCYRNIGYIVRRKYDSKDSSVNIFITKDGLRTECGRYLDENERKAFNELGLVLK